MLLNSTLTPLKRFSLLGEFDFHPLLFLQIANLRADADGSMHNLTWRGWLTE